MRCRGFECEDICYVWLELCITGLESVCKEEEDAWTASAEFISWENKKVEGHPITFHEALRGAKLFNVGARWGWEVTATPRPLYPRERDPVPRGWVGSRAGLDRRGKSRPHQYSIPDCPDRSESLRSGQSALISWYLVITAVPKELCSDRSLRQMIPKRLLMNGNIIFSLSLVLPHEHFQLSITNEISLFFLGSGWVWLVSMFSVNLPKIKWHWIIVNAVMLIILLLRIHKYKVSLCLIRHHVIRTYW